MSNGVLFPHSQVTVSEQAVSSLIKDSSRNVEHCSSRSVRRTCDHERVFDADMQYSIELIGKFFVIVLVYFFLIPRSRLVSSGLFSLIPRSRFNE